MKMNTERRALDKIFKRRDRYEIPEWQRDEVWPEEKKALLIDSVLRGWKLPKFYFSKTSESPEEFEVVDGQQRLAAIFEFYEGKITMPPRTADEFGGATYQELNDDVVDQFDDYEIEIDVITDASEKDLREFFQRLQGGLQLTSSEKLNAVHSKLTDFVRNLAKHAFFREKVAAGNARKAHFDIVSKVAAIQIDGIDTGLRYEDLRATFEANSNFSPTSNVGRRLKATLEFLNRVYKDRDSSLRNRSTIQSFITLAAKFVEAGNHEGNERLVYRFFDHFSRELARQVELGQSATDQDYLEFQRTLSANVRAGAKIRHQILIRKLLAYDPALAVALGPSAIAESGLTAEITRLADAISTQVADLNERYSAAKGEDLFKATNKTTRALKKVGKRLEAFDGYKDFVEDLYYLLWEGCGQRLTGHVPHSFDDVNSLRTGLRHDVDHGRPADVAKKRRKLAEAFKKYSGETSPQGLAPELFAVVQANLLRAIDADMRELSWA